MTTKLFNKRVWLNDEHSPSTGSAVGFHGEMTWRGDGVKRPSLFLEVADCHSKMRLHRTKDESIKDFVFKLRRLRGLIDDFLHFLDMEYPEISTETEGQD